MRGFDDRSQVPGRIELAPDRRGGPRAAKLAAIRISVADGTYETTERLEAAVDRLLAEIGRDV